MLRFLISHALIFSLIANSIFIASPARAENTEQNEQSSEELFSIFDRIMKSEDMTQFADSLSWILPPERADEFDELSKSAYGQPLPKITFLKDGFEIEGLSEPIKIIDLSKNLYSYRGNRFTISLDKPVRTVVRSIENAISSKTTLLDLLLPDAHATPVVLTGPVIYGIGAGLTWLGCTIYSGYKTATGDTRTETYRVSAINRSYVGRTSTHKAPPGTVGQIIYSMAADGLLACPVMAAIWPGIVLYVTLVGVANARAATPPKSIACAKIGNQYQVSAILADGTKRQGVFPIKKHPQLIPVCESQKAQSLINSGLKNYAAKKAQRAPVKSSKPERIIR